jgi:hypothetical protein
MIMSLLASSILATRLVKCYAQDDATCVTRRVGVEHECSVRTAVSREFKL